MASEKGIAWWKSNANAYMQIREDSIYLCRFENLIGDPFGESDRIGEFFGVRNLNVFNVRETKTVDLARDIQRYILEETREEREFFGYVD